VACITKIVVRSAIDEARNQLDEKFVKFVTATSEAVTIVGYYKNTVW